jgi:hypothetical protein
MQTPPVFRNRLFTRLILTIVLFLVIALLTLCLLLFFMTSMPGASIQPPLPVQTPSQAALEVRLRNHVGILATLVGPRHAETPANLDRAGDYVRTQLLNLGYDPQEIYFGEGRFRNIEGMLPGTGTSNEIIVIGAHYDTSPTGTPGADDNASGVAVMLEIARALAGSELSRSVRFIGFTNEERPWFNTDLMGSRVSANASAATGEQIIGMFSLEMLGYYSDAPGSQQYPPIIRHFYPDTGDFIAFVSNLRSRPFLMNALAAFREQQGFPSEGMAAPEALVGDIRRSDNSSYWDVGYPAVMVTDTSNFRSPHYHTLSDTPQTLDYESMARLTEALTGMVISLANTVK